VAKTLGGLTLPDSIEWPDRYEHVPVASAVDVTLGGLAVIHSAPLVKGQNITLQARDQVCWLDTPTVQALQSLAAVPGATYTLDWEGEQHTVMFSGQRPLRFDPVLPHASWWFATLILITV